jgi:hypothetical protein
VRNFGISLSTYFKSAPDVERLAAHAERLVALQQIYARAAPQYLAEASQVANYKMGSIVIHAANGGVAAKLKQLEPTLREVFLSSGAEVTGISVKVQGNRTVAPPLPVGGDRVIARCGASALSGLAETLPADSPLRAALHRFLEHARHGR